MILSYVYCFHVLFSTPLFYSPLNHLNFVASWHPFCPCILRDCGLLPRWDYFYPKPPNLDTDRTARLKYNRTDAQNRNLNSLVFIPVAKKQNHQEYTSIRSINIIIDALLVVQQHIDSTPIMNMIKQNITLFTACRLPIEHHFTLKHQPGRKLSLSKKVFWTKMCLEIWG